MANPTVETPIPLAGAGFVAKPTRRYNPGEYKLLNNIEINEDGYLTSRRNIISPRVNDYANGQTSALAVVSPINNPSKFIGHLGEYTLFINDTSYTHKQWAVGANTFVEMFAPASLPGNVGLYGGNMTSLVGFFRYNNKNYWITLELIANTSINIVVYSGNITATDLPTTYDAAYAGGLTRTIVLTYAYGSADYNRLKFRNFFMYKDRLWIATSGGLYFSKATDPTVFSTPNGGFFKHPNTNINWATPLQDVIYTFTSDSVYALMYNTDPNTDSTERPISDTIGAEMACVHQGRVYFINNLGIFGINGNSITKVFTNEFDVGKDFYSNRILSFEDYLVVQKYQKANYLQNNSAYDPYTDYNNFSKFDPFQGGNSLGYNVFFINTANGSVHILNYVDQYSPGDVFDPNTFYAVGNCGFIVDMVVNPNKDANGNYKLFFFTNKYINTTTILNYTGDVYYMESARGLRPYDYVRCTGNMIYQQSHKVDIEIDSFLPDGQEYRLKKFRSLMVETTLVQGMDISIAYDDKDFVRIINPSYINTTQDFVYVGQTTRSPFVHRLPLNQRSRSISLKIDNKRNWGQGDFHSPYTLMLISDLRLLWTPTQRVPIFNIAIGNRGS